MKLEGVCNQCGLCCFDGKLRCYNLDVHHIPGVPGATRCRVHGMRYPGMPIMLVDPDGVVAGLANCAHGTPQDEEEIIKKGIGKGCSLKLVS